MGGATLPPLGRPESAAWLVPFAIILAEIVGAAVAGEIRLGVSPSGIVQGPSRAPIGEELDTFTVAILFGAPYAALAAALVAHVGLRRQHPVVFSVGGILAGVVVYTIVGFAAVSIGQWWISAVPADTNQAAALFTALLVPPAALAAQLAVASPPVSMVPHRGGVAARFVLVGVMLGMILGSLLGSLTAALTWAVNCPQMGYVNCFSVSSVVSSALLIGTVVGMAIGAVTGSLAWLLRWRPMPG